MKLETKKTFYHIEIKTFLRHQLGFNKLRPAKYLGRHN